MADVHSKEIRSYNASKIKGSKTGIELAVQNFLNENKILYETNVKSLPGKPDIVLKTCPVIIDLRGCFWHCHKDCKDGDMIKPQSEIYISKIKSAVERDKRNEQNWKKLGYRVIIIWGCDLEIKKKNSLKRDKTFKVLLKKIIKFCDTSN